MTLERRERENRQAVIAALVMLAFAGELGWCASNAASWRAVAFAVYVTLTVLALGVSVLLFWVATSVKGLHE